MYLVSLKIQEGIGEKRVVKFVEFNKSGLNIVVDETKSGKGNNVGKTTFLKVIDLCLGSKDKKNLWIDPDTNSENKKLKNYIGSNKVYAELTVSINKSTHKLKKELFANGSQYIDEVKMKLTEYHSELNMIFFDHKGKPSFRQLISKFVRLEKNNGTSGILKFLHNTTTDIKYRNIYDFLFKLADPTTSERQLELDEFKNEQVKLKNDLLNAHSIENIDELSERIRLISNKASSQEKELDRYISLTKYQMDIENISKIKNDINKHNDLIETLNFKINKIQDIITSEENSEQVIDYSLLNSFYNDVKENVNGLKIQFEELVNFNEQIKINKINYYKKELRHLEYKLSETKENRKKLIENNSNILNLLDDNNFEVYKEIHEELLKNKELLGNLNEVSTAYYKISKKVEKIESEMDNLNYGNYSKDNLEIFNNYFSDLSEKVLGQRLYLVQSSGFPFKLSNIDDGAGSGHLKTIALLLDISYVHLLNKTGINHPMFFIHDVLESIDEHNIKYAVQEIKKESAQFIFAMLYEKVSNYDFINNDDIILRLSEDNKLFGI